MNRLPLTITPFSRDAPSLRFRADRYALLRTDFKGEDEGTFIEIGILDTENYTTKDI